MRGGCLSGSPIRVKYQSVSQDSVWIGCTYHQSLMTLESVYVAIPSARVKIQDGRKEKKKKKKHQDRVIWKNNQKNVAEWSKQDFRGCGEGISRRWGEWYPTG